MMMRRIRDLRRIMGVLALVVGFHGVGAIASQGQTTFEPAISYAQGYDDNLSGSGGNRIRSGLFEVAPEFLLSHKGRRNNWGLFYLSTVRNYSLGGQPTTTDHGLNFEGDFRLGRRWSLAIGQTFRRSPNPFFEVGRAETSAPVGELFSSANQSLFPPASVTTTHESFAQFSYRLSRYSELKWGAEYWQSEVDGLELVNNAWRKGLNVEYGHRYGSNKRVAIQYGLQWLGFNRLRDGFKNRTRTHSLFIVHDFELTPTINFNLFAGPQYSDLEFNPFTGFNFLVRESTVTLSVGASLAKEFSARNSFRIQLFRRVSDGGGFIGPVIENSVRLAFQRQLAPRTQFVLSVFGGENQEIVPGASESSFTSVGGSARLSFRLRRNLSLSTGYQYTRVSGLRSTFAGSPFSHNRVSIQLRYEFHTFGGGS